MAKYKLEPLVISDAKLKTQNKFLLHESRKRALSKIESIWYFKSSTHQRDDANKSYQDIFQDRIKPMFYYASSYEAFTRIMLGYWSEALSDSYQTYVNHYVASISQVSRVLFQVISRFPRHPIFSHGIAFIA